MPFETEKRLLGKDGGYRWFLFRYNPVLNESGDIVRWFATATDIEDRKQVEDRIRNEAVALREDIVHSVGQALSDPHRLSLETVRGVTNRYFFCWGQ